MAAVKSRTKTGRIPESREVKRAAEAARRIRDPELSRVARRAEELRGRPRTVGPVQVQRVQDALGRRDPMDVLGLSTRRAKQYAHGDVSVPAEERSSLRLFSVGMADPFCKGRGAAAILLALAGK
jgi:hypothetical protein